MQAKQNPQPSEVEGVSNSTSTAQLIRFLKGTYFAAPSKEGSCTCVRLLHLAGLLSVNCSVSGNI